MEFKEQSDLLKKVLGLKKEPLAISFTNEEISDGQYEKTSICKALKRAAEGNCLLLTKRSLPAPAVVDFAVSRKLPENRKEDFKGSLPKEKSSPVRLYPSRECKN
jgi:hypothetical protein